MVTAIECGKCPSRTLTSWRRGSGEEEREEKGRWERSTRQTSRGDASGTRKDFARLPTRKLRLNDTGMLKFRQLRGEDSGRRSGRGRENSECRARPSSRNLSPSRAPKSMSGCIFTIGKILPAECTSRGAWKQHCAGRGRDSIDRRGRKRRREGEES